MRYYQAVAIFNTTMIGLNCIAYSKTESNYPLIFIGFHFVALTIAAYLHHRGF